MSLQLQPGTTTVGFIGLGVMGNSMAGHIAKAGYELHVYTRTAAKAKQLLEQGAIWHDTPAKLAAASDVIITMVGFPQDVDELYNGENGLIRHAKEGAYLIDMTTSSPLLAKRIYEAAATKGLHVLDAPVSGGDIGARNAALSIMVGADEQVFENVLPLLKLMGSNIVRQGEPGAGQHTKMCNQIVIASNMIGVCESIAYAKKAGLNPKTVLASIETGAAGSWSLSNLGPRIIDGNFEPGFYVKHFIKDMGIALEAAREMGMDTPGLAQAHSLYQQLAELGHEDEGTQALYKLWDN
ncbi:NAD(P)-dependent oxidoreductase [Paenibacillaceae bacterium]|nr:NAD(P)-dependent oxidoreductase [Paenibacillaceae bacterium]